MEIIGLGHPITYLNGKNPKFEYFENLLDNLKTNLIADYNKGKPIYKKEEAMNFKGFLPELEAESYFVELKSHIISFNKDIITKKIQSYDKSYLSVFALYTLVKNYLYEINNIREKSTQKKYLEKLYQWFMKKIEERYRILNQQQSSTRLPTQIVDGQIKVMQGPLDLGKYSTRDMYNEKLRTLIPDINIPSVRIAKFKHRILSVPNINSDGNEGSLKISNIPKAQNEVPSQENQSLVNKQKNSTYEVTFYTSDSKSNYVNTNLNDIAIKGSYFSYIPTTIPEEQRLEKVWFSKRNQEIKSKRSQEELRDTLQEFGHNRAKFVENISRKLENLNNGSKFESRNYKTVQKPLLRNVKINYEAKYNETSDNENELPKMNKANTALKFLTKRSSLNMVKPSLIVKLSPLSEKVKGNLADKLKYSTLEVDRDRIDKIRKMKGRIIDGVSNRMDNIDNVFVNEATQKNAIPLSIFNKAKFQSKRPYSVVKKDNYVTLNESPIHCRLSLDSIRNAETDEINKMSYYFQRHSIPCTSRALTRVILTPSGYSRDKFRYENFMIPGSRLLTNPFELKGSKKKAKKKKKRNK